jgi:ubiquinone/menaquinone biosynthesis C-methylase UbiE
MTLARNRAVYRLWAPIYDRTVEHLFAPARRRAMQLLDLSRGEKVLLVGVGTGADLPLLPRGVTAVGVDLSAAMLDRARAKLPLDGRSVTLIEGNAEQLLVEEEGFDAAALNLILSVVPDAAACLHSTLRALRVGGRAVVFDKFRPNHARVSLARRALNAGSTLMGTDITRDFSELSANAPCVVTHDEPSLFGGAYRIILIERTRSV